MRDFLPVFVQKLDFFCSFLRFFFGLVYAEKEIFVVDAVPFTIGYINNCKCCYHYMHLRKLKICRNHRAAHRAFTGPLYGCHTVISTGAHTHFSEVGRVGFSVADYGSVSLPRGFILWKRKPRNYQTGFTYMGGTR